MKVLALETSGSTASVAALQDASVLDETTLSAAKRTAQTLAPGIRDLLQRVGWRPSDVQLVAVAVGPGSFTGLRLGVTTAKAFAYAVGAELLGVNTLEVIAARAPDECRQLEVVLDAQRREVFAGSFRRDESGMFATAAETRIVAIDEWTRTLTPETRLSGPMLTKLAEHLPDHVKTVDSSLWLPTAAAAGKLALRHFQAGQRADIWQLVPLYMRRSAAEENWGKAKTKRPGSKN